MKYEDALEHLSVTESTTQGEIHQAFLDRCQQHNPMEDSRLVINREMHVDQLVRCLEARDSLIEIASGNATREEWNETDDEAVHYCAKVTWSHTSQNDPNDSSGRQRRYSGGLLVTQEKLALIRQDNQWSVESFPWDNLTCCVRGPGTHLGSLDDVVIGKNSIALNFSSNYSTNTQMIIHITCPDSTSVGLIVSAISSQLTPWKRGRHWKRTDIIQADTLPLFKHKTSFICILIIVMVLLSWFWFRH